MSKLSADEAAGNYVSGNNMMKLLVSSSSLSSSSSSPSSNGGNGSSGSSNRALVAKKFLKVTLLFAAATVCCFGFYNSVYTSGFLLRSSYDYALSGTRTVTSHQTKVEDLLDTVLKNASMKNKTIIVTTLNDAWAEPNSIFDSFLESFEIGSNTKWLLKHLVVICLDKKAYARCLASHPHCYQLYTQGANFTSEAAFMSSKYLDMMWRRIQFLSSILDRGYNFVFTDTDIMWLRNPFPRFYPDADFQIACDYFIGDSYSMKNFPNGGFTYVKSNNRTIQFYKFWYFSRKAYPKMHDQDVLNEIKFDPFLTQIGLKMRFLDTLYFGGFCQASKDFNQVCTMHANCCVGLENKVNDLKILLKVWRKYMSLPPNATATPQLSWTVPQNCRMRNSAILDITGKRINVRTTLVFMAAAAVAGCFIVYNFVYPTGFRYDGLAPYLPSCKTTTPPLKQGNQLEDIDPLDKVLKNACMMNKTVIITTLNDAWAEPNSIFDLFLESFNIGSNTKWLLKHLLVICVDQTAYARCLASHPHCYLLYTPGANFTGEVFYLTPDYLQMMWRRTQILSSILDKGYNFVFTDTDIMWLRDPFPHFYPDADFQIATDKFLGDSYSFKNPPNCGFVNVKSNDRTIGFYKFWYLSKNTYPKTNEQDVLNRIKFDPFIAKIGLKVRFLDTKYFSGFCDPSKDVNQVCTMHANCCIGLENKVNDLKALLQVWKKYMSSPRNATGTSQALWTVPQKYCSTSFERRWKHNNRRRE
ncbi:hypothetical protein ACFX2J_015849 [Malus domestica]